MCIRDRANSGIVERVQGKGTFVRFVPGQSFSSPMAFSGGIKIAPFEHSNKCLLYTSDIGTVLFAAYLYGPQTGMYCVLGLIGRSTIVDTAIESLNLRKVCTVITSRPEPIRHFVTETLGRTATQQNATGVYLSLIHI